MALAGEADLTTRDELDRGLTHALSRTSGVLVVDVADLDFCDSLCATAVIEANCNTPDTQMVLVGGHGMVSRVFDLLDPAQTLTRHA
jgi:anti-anti-sigma factor